MLLWASTSTPPNTTDVSAPPCLGHSAPSHRAVTPLCDTRGTFPPRLAGCPPCSPAVRHWGPRSRRGVRGPHSDLGHSAGAYLPSLCFSRKRLLQADPEGRARRYAAPTTYRRPCGRLRITLFAVNDQPAVEFDYRLVGTGWSEARFAIDEAWVTLTASYLEDALGGLLGAMLKIALGDEKARCSWEEEPGEYRWILTRDGERLRVQILAFPDLYDNSPDEQGRPVLDAETYVRPVIAAVVRGAERVLAEHGASGYREKWVDHDFPSEELQQLKRHLDGAPG